jgi:hypothetical protein
MSGAPKNHVQCRLLRWEDPNDPNNDRRKEYICWIPEKHAVELKTLRIKQEDDSWQDGWIVMNVYTKIPTAVVEERSQDYKNTRKASDI